MKYRPQEKQGDCLQAGQSREQRDRIGTAGRGRDRDRAAALRILARVVRAQVRQMYRVSEVQAWTLRHRRTKEFIETPYKNVGKRLLTGAAITPKQPPH